MNFKDTTDYTKLSDSILDKNSNSQNQDRKTAYINNVEITSNKEVQHSGFCKFLSTLGAAITFIRNLVLNTLFIIILILTIIGIKACDSFVDDNNEVQEISSINKKGGPVLYLNLSGIISEAPEPTDGYAKLTRELEKSLNDVQSTDVITVERVLEKVATDTDIKEVFVDLSNISGVTLPVASRIAKAISTLKNKRESIQITAYANFYTKGGYVIASACDSIVLNPLGSLTFKGMSLSNLYFRDILENFGVMPLVFKAGEYKSAVEPITSKGMSEAVKEEYTTLTYNLWDEYLSEIRRESARNTLKSIFANEAMYTYKLRNFGGDEAKLFKSLGIVDELQDKILLTNNFAKKYSVNRQKASDVYTSYENYLKKIQSVKKAGKKSDASVAVIYGIGTITDNSDNDEAFTPANIKAQLKQVEKLKNVKTIIFYINSGGGSVTASENIRALIADYKEKHDVKIVVSMNSLAASGAYWIATAAHSIYATHDTITGSIGVFAVIPDIHQLLNEHGIYHDGVSTSAFEDYSVAKKMPQITQELYTMHVESIYKKFIDLAKYKRAKLRVKHYKSYAEGRIFLASDAKNIGLIDYIGDLNRVIEFEKNRINKKHHLKNIDVVHIGATNDNSMSLLKAVLNSKATALIPNEYLKLILNAAKAVNDKPTVQKGIMAITPVAADFD